MKLLDQLNRILTPERRQERLNRLEKQIQGYRQELSALARDYITPQQERSFAQRWSAAAREAKRLSRGDRRGELTRFLREYEALEDIVAKCNAAWYQREEKACGALLSHIDGKSLDAQQRTAVLCGAERTLVIAGAGSGKTLTIAAKVKYLCERRGVAPEDILLLSFTRKSADEMTHRIRDRLGLRVTASTFHKLGLDILTRAGGRRPEVVDSLRDFVGEYLEKRALKNPELVRKLLVFFAYYLQLPPDWKACRSLGEAYELERSADLETLRGKYRLQKYLEQQREALGEQRRSLRREQLKSMEEVTIANFLFLHGVDYVYERAYPFPGEDRTRKAYRPDFYLPDYDLYLEHFGIAADGSVPWLDRIEAAKYQEEIRWKRAIHAKNGTVLLETYSYYASEGRLLTELERLLTERGVTFREPDLVDIFHTVYGSAGERCLSELTRLCSTFLTLFKSGGHGAQELQSLNGTTTKQHPFFRQRTELFLSIVGPLLKAYNDSLQEQGAVDFSDMINWAAALVEGGCEVQPWQWVIVDEFQDCSVARYRLIRAILEQTGAKLLCVGDDWQSIYRFAGSDLSLFTRFEDYFGPAELLFLERTYRNAQQLIDEAGRFVMKNPNQYAKHLRSDKSLDYPLVFLFYEDDPRAKLKQAMDKCIRTQGAGGSILLLGRTNFDLELLRSSGLFQVGKGGALRYVYAPDTPVSFLTVHRSKGLEADNVILLNFRGGTLGFPNRITDDPLLELVLTRGEGYPHAEERRLFYVAMTRTRNRTYILTDKGNPSAFLGEFAPSRSVFLSRQSADGLGVPCPRCRTGRLTLRQSEGGMPFVGCTNYPRCNYTLSDTTVLEEPRYCPECGGLLVRRRGEWGEFFGCSNFPHCTYKE